MIRIKIGKDKLAGILVEGYSSDGDIEIGIAKAFDPCIVDDGFLNIRQVGDGVLSEVKISIGELGFETIYALAFELMKKLKEEDSQANIEQFLYSILDASGSKNLEQANELILKILEMVE